MPANVPPGVLTSAQTNALAELLRIAPVADRLGELFDAAGHELYLVGGSVRDALMGRLGNDLDFTTSARPDEIETLLRRFTAGIQGAAVWDIGKEYGTIGARVPILEKGDDPLEPPRCAGSEKGDDPLEPPRCAGSEKGDDPLEPPRCAGSEKGDDPLEPPRCAGSEKGDDPEAYWLVEITTFRADVYREDSRKPEVAFGDSIDGDLIRRDFTVNAMAIRLPGRTFVDPYGGLIDLAGGLLRTPATAEQSFSDDPLRMLRAVRFTSQLQRPDGTQFVPAPEVVAALLAMAERIGIVSAERIRDELNKLILTAHPRAGLNLLVESGLAEHVLPELPALRLEVDEHHRHKDVYQHSLTVLEQSIDLERARGHQPDLIGRWAALLHDIGKPATRRFTDGGKVTFHHHDVVGAKQVRKRLQKLRFANTETKAIAKLVELHLRFHGYGDGLFDHDRGWTDSAVRRYVRDAGDQVERLHILTRADCTTRNQRKANRLRRAYDDLEERIDRLAEQEELDAVRPDLNGEQIMTLLDLKPSRAVGEAYKFLLEQRMEHGPLGEERATELLRQWWTERSESQH